MVFFTVIFFCLRPERCSLEGDATNSEKLRSKIAKIQKKSAEKFVHTTSYEGFKKNSLYWFGAENLDMQLYKFFSASR